MVLQCDLRELSFLLLLSLLLLLLLLLLRECLLLLEDFSFVVDRPLMIVLLNCKRALAIAFISLKLVPNCLQSSKTGFVHVAPASSMAEQTAIFDLSPSFRLKACPIHLNLFLVINFDIVGNLNVESNSSLDICSS